MESFLAPLLQKSPPLRFITPFRASRSSRRALYLTSTLLQALLLRRLISVPSRVATVVTTIRPYHLGISPPKPSHHAICRWTLPARATTLQDLTTAIANATTPFELVVRVFRYSLSSRRLRFLQTSKRLGEPPSAPIRLRLCHALPCFYKPRLRHWGAVAIAKKHPLSKRVANEVICFRNLTDRGFAGSCMSGLQP